MRRGGERQFFAFVPADLADSEWQRELVTGGFRLVDGRISPPSEPGLGGELDEDPLERYRWKALA